MSVHYTDDAVTLYHGDCLDVLKELPDNSVDAVVTDPPYGLANTTPALVAETVGRWLAGERDYLPGGAGFMGKAWDAFVPPVAVWDECLRVLKPGGHLLAFAGSRTFDLMSLSVRLAGFDIRDGIAWLYGSGFPKSRDVSEAMERFLAGHWTTQGEQPAVPSPRQWEVLKEHLGFDDSMDALAAELGSTERPEDWGTGKGDGFLSSLGLNRDNAATPGGWGTALKPAFEPVVVARKPIAGTVAGNVLAHGTGALNIDGCRVGDEVRINPAAANKPGGASLNLSASGMPQDAEARATAGRWPTNVVLDDSQAAALDEQSGERGGGFGTRGASTEIYGGGKGFTEATGETVGYGDTGGASRFFPTFRYEAKAPATERPRVNGTAHPTVKPLDLMRWLVRLVTPPGGVVLEPFAGSGTTAEACVIEGFRCIAIEREADYLPLITQRLTKPIAPVLDIWDAL